MEGLLKVELEVIIEEKGLEFIDTTEQRNGYPSNLKRAVVGFKNYGEAKELADVFDLNIESFHRRDGWGLWHREGSQSTPFEISSVDYGDDYSLIPKMDEDEFIENQVQPILEQGEDFESIEAIIKTKKEVWDEVAILNDNEAVITFQGNYHTTIQIKTMDFSEDTHNYVIGVSL